MRSNSRIGSLRLLEKDVMQTGEMRELMKAEKVMAQIGNVDTKREGRRDRKKGREERRETNSDHVGH